MKLTLKASRKPPGEEEVGETQAEKVEVTKGEGGVLQSALLTSQRGTSILILLILLHLVAMTSILFLLLTEDA